MDEWDAMGHGMKVDRRSTDWGIVSLTIGACFLIMAPIMLHFNVYYWLNGVRVQTRDELQVNRLCTVVIDGFFIALIVFGVFAGFRSMSLARATQHPTAIGLGGVLICGLNVILWIGLGLYLLAVMNTFV
jgi:hypothetical protein